MIAIRWLLLELGEAIAEVAHHFQEMCLHDVGATFRVQHVIQAPWDEGAWHDMGRVLCPFLRGT